MGTLFIPLSNRKSPGLFAEIDEEDWSLVAPYEWIAHRSDGTWYARTYVPRDGKLITIDMHNLILPLNDGRMVDHRDGDGLMNRRSNLRPSTNSQNQQNRHRLSTNTSGYRGVTWHRAVGKWQAGIKLNGKTYHLGLHKEIEDAARAYDEKAVELFGEFARLNFPTGKEQAA